MIITIFFEHEFIENEQRDANVRNELRLARDVRYDDDRWHDDGRWYGDGRWYDFQYGAHVQKDNEILTSSQ